MKLIILQQNHAEVSYATRIVTLEFESKEAVDKLIDDYMSSCPKNFSFQEYRKASPSERIQRSEARTTWAKQQPDLQIAQIAIKAKDLVVSSTYVYDLDSFFEEFKEG